MLRPALACLALFAAAPALAGELKPAPKPKAPDCAVHGQGFIGLGGTSTCVRVSGRVRAEGMAVGPAARGQPSTALGTSGQVNIDSRTSTDYGTVRAVVRVKGGVPSGTN
jgi:hypothetical protein